MSTHIPSGAVVVGVDGSDASRTAIDKAAEQATLEHRPLHLLHAQRIPAPYPPPVLRQFDNMPALLREAAQHTAREALEYATSRFPDLAVTVSVSENDPREALRRAAQHASVIVVGSRGLGGIASLLLGSVSLWVSQHVDCPTLVVRPSSAGDDAPIMVGTDDTEASADALEFAFAQASLRRSPLVVVHCFDENFQGGYGLTGVPDEDLEGLPEERLGMAESIAGLREKYVDVDVTFELGRGRAADYLVHASERAQLLVVGSHQRSAAAAFFAGTVSRPVVEHATCTVAVVPAQSTREG
jgi:nucleotide-binding universal stress UspA family protein